MTEQAAEPSTGSVIRSALLWSSVLVSIHLAAVAITGWDYHRRSDVIEIDLVWVPLLYTTPFAWVVEEHLGQKTHDPTLPLCIGGVIQWTFVGFMIPMVGRAWRRWLAA